jgi:hypothetical protein
MINQNNSNEVYDNYIKSYIDYYTVTEFIGSGKYDKVTFKKKSQALTFQKMRLTRNPNARCLVYGVSFPPHTVLPVNIPILERV